MVRGDGNLRGGIKKLFFFLLFVKKGGVSANTKKTFLTREGGLTQSKRFFWHNLPKKGGFIKKTWFLPFFAEKGDLTQVKKILIRKN